MVKQPLCGMRSPFIGYPDSRCTDSFVRNREDLTGGSDANFWCEQMSQTLVARSAVDRISGFPGTFQGLVLVPTAAVAEKFTHKIHLK